MAEFRHVIAQDRIGRARNARLNQIEHLPTLRRADHVDISLRIMFAQCLDAGCDDQRITEPANKRQQQAQYTRLVARIDGHDLLGRLLYC